MEFKILTQEENEKYGAEILEMLTKWDDEFVSFL